MKITGNGVIWQELIIKLKKYLITEKDYNFYKDSFENILASCKCRNATQLSNETIQWTNKREDEVTNELDDYLKKESLLMFKDIICSIDIDYIAPMNLSAMPGNKSEPQEPNRKRTRELLYDIRYNGFPKLERILFVINTFKNQIITKI